MVWDTAGNIINAAAVEMGLDADTDPFASTDPTMVQLVALLKSRGRALNQVHRWTQFKREHTFVTVQGTSVYTLPADFLDMADQTAWNRTTRLPLGGPISGQEWQYLKSRLANVVFTVLFRPIDKTIVLYPDTDTPGGYTIAFEYRSRYWAGTTDVATAGTKLVPTLSTDYVYFDPNLATNALKLDWKRAKGFDSTAESDDYDEALTQAKNVDSASPILNLTRRSLVGVDPLVGPQSVPITGFGS